jgi:hypothetical protein
MENDDDAIVSRCGNGTQLDVTKSTVGTADLGFAWFDWIINPGKNALSIMQLKG